MKQNQRFFERVFTKGEIAYCESKAKAAQHYAARFCAKEAAVTEWKWAAEQDEVAKQQCLDKGMILSAITDEPVWQEKARTIWPKFYDKVGGKATVDEAISIMSAK